VVGGQSHASAALPPGKAWYRRLDGMREQVWTGMVNIATTGIRSVDSPGLGE
jgi:hypothetical protein